MYFFKTFSSHFAFILIVGCQIYCLLSLKQHQPSFLKLEPKICETLFWNYMDTLQYKIDMKMVNEEDEKILEYVKKLIEKKKQQILEYEPPTVYWYSRQG